MYLKVMLVILLELLISIPNSEMQVCFNSSVTRYCKMQCRQPQPRVYRTTELFDLDGVPHMPYMVQINRCDASTGCCQSGDLCDVAKYKNVTFRLIVKNMDTSKYMLKSYTAVNHTECCCKKFKEDIIK